MGERPNDTFCLTKNDEIVKWILIDAAVEAGYRGSPVTQECVGINAPAKVCRLIQAIHRRVVGELERREEENGRTTRVDQNATHQEGGAEDGQNREDDYGTETGGDS